MSEIFNQHEECEEPRVVLIEGKPGMGKTTYCKKVVDGAAALGECLKCNKSLTTLDLSDNEIGDDGAAALGECLKYNKSVTTLDLSDNEIGDDGAAALGECLKYNKSLTTLNLGSNKIGDDGAAALVVT